MRRWRAWRVRQAQRARYTRRTRRARLARRHAPWAGLLLGLVVVAAALVPSAPVGAGPVPAPAAVPVAVAAVPSPPAPPDRPPRTPLLLHVPVLDVHARIVPVDVTPDGLLPVPDDPAVLSWWRGGGVPGTGQGSVVLAGHVDTRAAGPGAFFGLAGLRPGDPVSLDDTGRRQHYQVVAVRSWPKADLPAETFDVRGQPRLVLISCGGSFDRVTRRYSDNVVVFAVPRTPS